MISNVGTAVGVCAAANIKVKARLQINQIICSNRQSLADPLSFKIKSIIEHFELELFNLYALFEERGAYCFANFGRWTCRSDSHPLFNG